jgi:hypothetical protein
LTVIEAGYPQPAGGGVVCCVGCVDDGWVVVWSLDDGWVVVWSLDVGWVVVWSVGAPAPGLLPEGPMAGSAEFWAPPGLDAASWVPTAAFDPTDEYVTNPANSTRTMRIVRHPGGNP